MELEKAIQAEREGFSLLPLDTSQLSREGKILVACSGGADSVALLLALHDAKYFCVAAHINHGMRGAQSDGDEEFVRELCARLKIPFVAKRLELPPHAGEAEMREARYGALLACARKYFCNTIATGHSANDHLETVLLNWLRGAGVVGMAGIAPVRELDGEVLLVRPLLGATRREICEFLRARGQDWREDASNQSPQYLRNRVRHELVPLLAELGHGEEPLLRQTLRASEIWREETRFLDELAQESLQALALLQEKSLLILDALKFRELPIALQRRVLRQAAFELDEETRDLGFARVEEARLHIMENKRRAVWQWRKNLLVEWTGEYSGNRIRFKRV